MALQLVSGSKKGQRTLAIQIARAAGLKLFCAFSPSEKRFAFLRRPQITLEAFSMMGEAFTSRDISHGKNPSRKFYSQNLAQYDLSARLGSAGNSREPFPKTRSHQTHHSCRSLSDCTESSFSPWKSHYRPSPPATEIGADPFAISKIVVVLLISCDTTRRGLPFGLSSSLMKRSPSGEMSSGVVFRY